MHIQHLSAVTAGMTTSLPTPQRVRLRGGAMFCALFALFTSAAHASIRWATLEAIHQLENPRNLSRPGPFGELGAYQFRPTTWQMHTKVPFNRALDRQASDEVAVRHYEWLKQRLAAANIPATPYNIGLA